MRHNYLNASARVTTGLLAGALQHEAATVKILPPDGFSAERSTTRWD
jgi:hypothetical protein